MRYDTVTVSAQVLQDLVYNVELLTAGQGHTTIEAQCRKLQGYLDESASEYTGHINRGNVTFAAFGGK